MLQTQANAQATLYTPAELHLNQKHLEIAFVLDNLTDWQTLAAGVPTGVEVVVLDSRGDGLAQMADWLAQKTPGSVDAIHLLSHGSSGALHLGTLTLDTEQLSSRTSALNTLKNAFSSCGDLLLYGCNVAKGSKGGAFIRKLVDSLGINLAASTNNTGAFALGGNWVLESEWGELTAGVFSFPNYRHILDPDTQTRWEVPDTTPDDSGASLSSYLKDGFTVTSNGYIESDSFQIAVGTHAEGTVGVNFTRTASGTPTTITIERTDGSEVWFKSLNFGSMFTGSADVASQIDVQAFKDGVAVSPVLRGKFSTSGNHFFNHPGS